PIVPGAAPARALAPARRASARSSQSGADATLAPSQAAPHLSVARPGLAATRRALAAREPPELPFGRTSRVRSTAARCPSRSPAPPRTPGSPLHRRRSPARPRGLDVGGGGVAARALAVEVPDRRVEDEREAHPQQVRHLQQ